MTTEAETEEMYLEAREQGLLATTRNRKRQGKTSLEGRFEHNFRCPTSEL